MKTIPKQRLSKKQMQAITDILQDAFEKSLRESDYAWLLDTSPTVWASNITYKYEQQMWDMAEAVQRHACNGIEKLLFKPINEVK